MGTFSEKGIVLEIFYPKTEEVIKAIEELDKQESQQQCRCEGLSDKAGIQLHASVEAVLEKSAERVPRFVFPKDTT